MILVYNCYHHKNKKNILKVLKKENSLDNALYGAKYDTISRSNENDVYNKWIW